MLAFTNYFAGEPWGDVSGGNDIGGRISYGWKSATGSTFVVATGFRGLGTYSLELLSSDPAASYPNPANPLVRVSAVCSAKRCRLLPGAPKPPAGTTVMGVSMFRGGEREGTLAWQVPLPGNPGTVWLRITTSGSSAQGDRTAVLKAVRHAGTGNSYLVLAGS